MEIIRTIQLIDTQGTSFYDGPFPELPLREPLILEKCWEFFKDKNPCFLHRSAAVSRILIELEENFKKLSGSNDDVFSWHDLTEGMRYILAGNNVIDKVAVQWIRM